MNTNKVAGTHRRLPLHPADLKDVVWYWADRIGVKVREIHLRQMQQKWASISMKGRLTLNTELLDLPEALTEFVIVHELVHLLVPNHGKLFKGYMSAYLPDWEDRQNRLRSL
ncbi:MAG: M48 family metallopeptidase [Candidatus Poribacteria bacterium]|nr:M48 family metallopeptidase [Candidatus Poribacteria bacterium]MDD9973554.1 M48 family metallopeptidase [Candidatus Poribacteria bacterium]